MATVTKFRLSGSDRQSYLQLVDNFPLASIKSDAQLAAAQEVLDDLLAKGKLDRGAETYLDALSDLVATYEEARFPIAPPSDGEMLRHLMDARGVSQVALSRETGIPKSSISEVLAGKKPLSRTMIRKLADFFHVDVAVLAANL